jgi:hypothetical protein
MVTIDFIKHEIGTTIIVWGMLENALSATDETSSHRRGLKRMIDDWLKGVDAGDTTRLRAYLRYWLKVRNEVVHELRGYGIPDGGYVDIGDPELPRRIFLEKLAESNRMIGHLESLIPRTGTEDFRVFVAGLPCCPG